MLFLHPRLVLGPCISYEFGNTKFGGIRYDEIMSEVPNKVGRPKKGAVARQRYTLTLDPEVMARVDSKAANRSEFINYVLEQWFCQAPCSKGLAIQPKWIDGTNAGYELYQKELASLKDDVLAALQEAGFSYLDRHEGGIGIELRLKRDYELKEIVKGTPARFNGQGWEVRPTEYAHFVTHVLPAMRARQAEMTRQIKEVGEHYDGIASCRLKGYYQDLVLHSLDAMKTDVPRKGDMLDVNGRPARIKGIQDRSRRGKPGPPYKIRIFYWPVD